MLIVTTCRVSTFVLADDVMVIAGIDKANAFYHPTEALLSPDAISPIGERRYYYRGTADTATTLGRYCDH
jgi:hypothetical protein